LHDNKFEIESYFKNIFNQRFENKFQKRFATQYSEDAIKEGVERFDEKKSLKDHYDKIWTRFQKGYLNLENAKTYHPRILFGMYAMHLFQTSVDKIRKSGIKVNLHPKTKVLFSDKKNPESPLPILSFADQEKPFDHVFIATGVPFDKGEVKSEKYISQAWPIKEAMGKLRQLANDEIKRRKLEGRELKGGDKIIRIAIQGDGLTSIDVLMSIYADTVFSRTQDGSLICRDEGFEEEGYQVHVTVVAKTRSFDKWHQYNAAKEIIGDDFRKNKQPDSILNVGQLFLVHALAFEKAGNWEDEVRNISKKIIRFLSTRSDLSDKEIEDVMGKAKDRNSFECLQKISDNFKLDYNKSIVGLLRQELFGEEQHYRLGMNFLNSFVDSFSNQEFLTKDLAKNAESLKFINDLSYVVSLCSGKVSNVRIDQFMDLFEAGLIHQITIGERPQEAREVEGKIIFVKESGEFYGVAYDVVINARGQHMDKTKSELFQSMKKAGFIDFDERGNHRPLSKMVSFSDNYPEISSAYKSGVIAQTHLTQPVAANLSGKVKSSAGMTNDS
jgi:hypothetical protein